MDELASIEPLQSSHDLSGFDCGEIALNLWLARHAMNNQSSNNSRTYVLATTAPCGSKVVGFYALVSAILTHTQALPSLRAGTPTTQVIPAVLLGRLAVSSEYQGRGLGKALLKDALRQCLSASRIIGIRAVLVHAKSGKEAFYINFGFAPSPTDPMHLILPIETLANAI